MKKIPFALLMLALLAGCDTEMVLMSKPLPPAQLSAEDRKLLEGSWVVVAQDSPGVVYSVHFVCDGAARVVTLFWQEDGGKFRVLEGELTVSRGKKRGKEAARTFLSMTWRLGPTTDDYNFMRFQYLGRGEAMLWDPTFEPYLDALRSGKLKGREAVEFDGHYVHISDPEALLNFLDEEGGADKFMYRVPMVLHKVGAGKVREPLPKCK